jgi:uncharacterized protein YprB with RNaseH-like and TPR domain
MVRNTFCHIPGIGVKTEKNLWHQGLHRWEDLLNEDSLELPRIGHRFMRSRLQESVKHLEEERPTYFTKLLPTGQAWRIFPDFRDSTAYLDIETTGLGTDVDHITTIALYDGESVSYYVYGRNLQQFVEDISKFKVIVTYNGKCFDIPFIEKYFKIKIDHAHIDLRFLLKSLGYTGGLKGCEKKMGLDRKELDGVDGYLAVLLWEEFQMNGNEEALETLLAYNILDAANLETLMVKAYNLKLKDTPFHVSHNLPIPDAPDNPLEPHLDIVKKILDERYGTANPC